MLAFKPHFSQFEVVLLFQLVANFFLNLCSITDIVLSTDPSKVHPYNQLKELQGLHVYKIVIVCAKTII